MDFLGIASLVALGIVGSIAVLDALMHGTIEPGVLALLATTVGAVITAWVARENRRPL